MELGLPELVLALITLISPLIVAIANRCYWSPKVKNSVAAIVALAIALGYLIITGGITDWSDIVTVSLSVYGLQQLVYKQILAKISSEVEQTVNSGSPAKIEENKAQDPEPFTGDVKG